MMSTPAKRALTSDVHDSILASNAQRTDGVSDDLAARLQNVGSRVRKSVAEGYHTPPTQSPVKHTSPAGFVAPAKDTLQHVFGSPTRARGTPSPLKRARADDEDDHEMDCDTDTDDDEDVLITPGIVVGSAFPRAKARPVRPLRRPRVQQPVFAAAAPQQPDVAMDYTPFAAQVQTA